MVRLVRRAAPVVEAVVDRVFRAASGEADLKSMAGKLL